jgi:hypothetical protein
MDTPDDSVTVNTVYSEMYNEIRRCRDYEMTASTWYTAILLGVLVAIVSAKYGDQTSDLKKALQDNLTVQGFLALIYTLVGGLSIYSIRYMNLLGDNLRKYVNTLEPLWHNFRVDYLKKRRVSPFCALAITQAVVVLGGVFIVCLQPQDYCRSVVAMAISLLILVAFFFCLPNWRKPA